MTTTPLPEVRPPRRLSRRGLLGGTLATALAAVLVPRDRLLPERRSDRWHGKTRWIGHA
ncbi:MAG: twin-arginine translocation signal domain-containing protein [Kofleriaceae bacterium]